MFQATSELDEQQRRSELQKGREDISHTRYETDNKVQKTGQGKFGPVDGLNPVKHFKNKLIAKAPKARRSVRSCRKCGARSAPHLSKIGGAFGAAPD